MADVSSLPLIGNYNAGMAPQSQITMGTSVPATTANSGGSAGGLDSLLGSLLGTGLGTAASVYGSQNASEAQNNGILAGIGTQNQTLGNINNLFSTQVGAGNNAFTSLGTTNPFSTQQAAGNNAFSQLQTLQGGGPSGAAPNYSGFSNSPGYQFAVQQGENAIRSGAAANGAAYSPTTLANLGQFVTGTASQNYNNYVQQLLGTAGLGAQGNSGQLSQMLGVAGLGAQGNNTLASANLGVGGNISQLQQNSGVVQGAGVNSAAGSIGGALSGLLGGVNGSGVISGIGSLINSASNGINNLFGNPTSTNSGVGGFGNYNGYSSDPNSPNYIGNVGNVGGNGVISQYGIPAAPDNSSFVTDPNSLSNPYGNLDFSGNP